MQTCTKPEEGSAADQPNDLYTDTVQALDESAHTLKTITALQGRISDKAGKPSERIDLSIMGIMDTVVNVAAEVTGGDLEETRKELSKRGLDDLLD